jgi:hypothetical protein
MSIKGFFISIYFPNTIYFKRTNVPYKSIFIEKWFSKIKLTLEVNGLNFNFASNKSINYYFLKINF